ncbi:class I SAM-dependent methyltransferase [Candidatus Saccharibacteria bacterium]|nr:class I SAM-dependent methyltransferase [Candidatus Saccharibacteria bacterium]
MSRKIPDQKPIWDRKHAEGDHEKLRHSPNPLAKLAEPYLSKRSKILELGCGVGGDAVFFTDKGHKVIATDVSDVVVEQNKRHFANTDVKFSVLDMRKPLPYKPESFDVVYVNLSLHYYSHDKTRKIVKEVAKVLKPDGIFAFACKSVDDFHYGKGDEVEKDVFVSEKGRVRHLFSIPYTRELLEGMFDIGYLDMVEEEYNGQRSNILRCIAKKSGQNRGQL